VFELEDVEVSVELDFCCMVNGGMETDYPLVFLIAEYEKYCIDLALYLGPYELGKSSLNWSKVG